MRKIMVVSTSFSKPRFWKRWQMLRDICPDLDVTVVAPDSYETGKSSDYTFGVKMKSVGESYSEDRFHARIMKIKQNIFGDYKTYDFPALINDIKPNYIYFIGQFKQICLKQLIKAKKKYAPHAKMMAFTMRGNLPEKKAGSLKNRIISSIFKRLGEYNTKNLDAIFCHYPDAVEAFRSEGVKAPVYINTQIGVDTDMFAFTQDGRDRIRQKYQLDNRYVFGCACRINPEKGILNIIEALPENDNCVLMIMGSGTESQMNQVKAKIKSCNVQNRVVLTGFIEWDELPDYLSAFDCAVHVPVTTEKWVETFSLALVQEMAVERPVIGSDSGSVPYQIGPNGVIVEQNNIQQLRNKMIYFAGHPNEGLAIGKLMRKRCINCFDIKHLAKCFAAVLDDLDNGVYNQKHIDTAEYKNW